MMVMESLFTGNEFFCEERYSPIANRTDIMHKAVYQSLLDKINSESVYENERMKAINKMILMKNKNVQQPTD
ncbi:capsule biosynthesis protein, partial [Kingella kingae]|nr:capsule biosynthesis protein [Kingella kingae]